MEYLLNRKRDTRSLSFTTNDVFADNRNIEYTINSDKNLSVLATIRNNYEINLKSSNGGFLFDYYSLENKNSINSRKLLEHDFTINKLKLFIVDGVEKDNSSLPSFNTLWSNYPKKITLNGISTNARPSGNPLYVNQCAIRLSECLIRSGVSLKNYPKDDLDKDNRKWALTANRLKFYLNNNFGKFGKMTQENFQKKYWNKTGVIFIEAIGGVNHIDLFNRGTTGSGYYKGDFIYFLEVL